MAAFAEGRHREYLGSGNDTLSAAAMDSNLKHRHPSIVEAGKDNSLAQRRSRHLAFDQTLSGVGTISACSVALTTEGWCRADRSHGTWPGEQDVGDAPRIGGRTALSPTGSRPKLNELGPPHRLLHEPSDWVVQQMKTASEGLHSRTPFGVTTMGRLMRIGCATMKSSRSSSYRFGSSSPRSL